MTRNLVILLHGVGSNGADLAPLGDFWRKSLPNTDFAAPDGPFPMGPGRQWFSIEGVTQANRAERVAGARAAFDRTLNAIIAAHNLTDHPERVALVGFSQGSIMALDALASGRWKVAAVVAFSGRLVSPPPLAPSTATRVLLIHGNADQVMPFQESEHAAAALSRLGVDVATHILPGVGHTISAQGAALAGAFLTEALAKAGGAE